MPFYVPTCMVLQWSHSGVSGQSLACDRWHDPFLSLIQLTNNLCSSTPRVLCVLATHKQLTVHVCGTPVQEIPEMAGVPSYWVNSAACVDVEANKITHKLAHGELAETAPWLRDGPLTIGVTSGASTPDRAVEEVLDKVLTSPPAFLFLQAWHCWAHASEPCGKLCIPLLGNGNIRERALAIRFRCGSITYFLLA